MLKGNLKMGKYGAETNSFIEVDHIYCTSNSKDTPWMIEEEFLRKIIFFLDDSKNTSLSSCKDFFTQRQEELANFAGDTQRGLFNNLFFKCIADKKGDILRIRKNFAFFDFDEYIHDVPQSDIHFTVSSIINTLRNNSEGEKQLRQTVYVRRLIDPGNFNRYNDGVIQASILRSANADELAYAIDDSISHDMFIILETLIKYYTHEQGEALLEFLYALAIKKMTLCLSHLEMLLEQIEETCKEEIFQCFAHYIKEEIINKPENIKKKSLKPLELVEGEL